MSVAVASPGRALTGEQSLAVQRRSESLLLSAAAGSGKTSVLVERFVRAVCEDELAPARILAITFTERAAGELRERIRARLLELGRRDAARDTETAFIGTFHGFCARVLRIHPLLAGLDPDFAILDEGLAGRLRALAFRGASAALLDRRGASAVDLFAAYGPDRMRGIVLGAYAELRSQGETDPRLPRPLARSSPDTAREALRLAGTVAIAELQETSGATSGKRLPAALQILGRAGEFLVENPRETPRPGALASLKLPGAAAGPLAGPACESYRSRLVEYIEACADAHAAQTCELIDMLLGDFARRYSELKRARGALDFDDLELCARELLVQHEDVRSGFSQRLDLMMVDEFQDTNRRQLAILQMLERENLFTVGDERQSIYGFRHAEVSIFRDRAAVLGSRGACLSLTRNFRSRAEIVETVNRAFVDRFGPAGELVPGREESDASAGDGPAVELLLTDRGSWDQSEERAALAEGLPRAREWRHAEARLLAQRIEDLIQAGEGRGGDVAILLRALGDLPLFERALRERGIRTVATAGGFWGQQQVGDTLAYLRALANPLDALALYSTIASPFVGISSDGLALLSREARARGGSVWDALCAYREGEGGGERQGDGEGNDGWLSEPDRGRLIAFLGRFSEQRRVAPQLAIAELIATAISSSGYDRRIEASSEGGRRLANVHKLLRLARRFESQEGRDLRGFLDHVTHQELGAAGAEPEAPVSDVEPDAVRLMSIHAAKGLEFAVVCVADLGRAPGQFTPDLLIDHGRIGLKLAELDGSQSTPALEYERLREQRRESEAAEEERILYVAMTRARDRLLLSGAADFERWPEDRPGAAPISWLAPALVDRLPEQLGALGESGDAVPRPASEIKLWLNTPATVGTVLRELGTRTSAGWRAPVVTDAALDGLEGRSGGGPAKPERAAASADPLSRGALSYTTLNEIERCGYRYYLERVLGLPESRAQGTGEGSRGALRARTRGVLVHKLLESLDPAPRASLTAEDVRRHARELGVSIDAREGASIAELLVAASETELARRLSAAQVRREHPFAFSLGPTHPTVTGVLDAFAQEPDGTRLVVDYKSDRVAPQDDLELLVEREYGVQRLIYALAALQDGALEVEIVHWFLERPEEWVSAGYRAEQLPRLSALLLARLERARERGYTVSEEPHRGLCLTCPGRGGLCSWDDSRTLAGLPASTTSRVDDA